MHVSEDRTISRAKCVVQWFDMGSRILVLGLTGLVLLTIPFLVGADRLFPAVAFLLPLLILIGYGIRIVTREMRAGQSWRLHLAREGLRLTMPHRDIAHAQVEDIHLLRRARTVFGIVAISETAILRLWSGETVALVEDPYLFTDDYAGFFRRAAEALAEHAGLPLTTAPALVGERPGFRHVLYDDPLRNGGAPVPADRAAYLTTRAARRARSAKAYWRRS